MEKTYEYYISGFFNTHRNSFNYRITKESYDELNSIGINNLIYKQIITFKRAWSTSDKEDMGCGVVKPSDLSSLNLYKKPR